MSNNNSIHQQLRSFKRKYHTNELIRGIIFFLAFLSALFLSLTTLEYLGRFPTALRGAFLFSFLIGAVISLVIWIILPVLKILAISKGISDDMAARLIGNHFPEIKDKLLNTLQLERLQSVDNELLTASISQRIESLKWYRFPKAVQFEQNRRFLKFVLTPLMLIVMIAFIIPELFSDGTQRILQYKKEFKPVAPFDFVVLNEELTSFRNDDFTLQLEIRGDQIPSEVFIINDGRKQRLKKEGDEKNMYSFTWRKIQDETSFELEAAGFSSNQYTIVVISKPELASFLIKLDYPAYTRFQDEKIQSIGDLTIPEGTNLFWQIQTRDADSLVFNHYTSDTISTRRSKIDDNLWTFNYQAIKPSNYNIDLISNRGFGQSLVKNRISIIKDQFPSINGTNVFDSLLFQYAVISGSISDDYGFTDLKLEYQKKDQTGKVVEKGARRLNFSPSVNSQNYYYEWNISDLNIASGERLEYHVAVWDNDVINGAKRSKTQSFSINIPDKSTLREELNEKDQSIENQMSNLQKQVEGLQKEIKAIQDQTKSKKELEWKDKNRLRELLKKHEALKAEMEKINEDMKSRMDKKDAFDKSSEQLSEKAEQLKKLMNEVLDEETKKMLEELEKLLEEKSDNADIQKQLEDLNEKNYNFEKELDRALELFKQLQFEDRMEKAIEKLDELAVEQEKLADKSEEKGSKSEEIQKEQEKLNNSFEELREEMDKLDELDKSMKSPNNLENTDQEESQIQEEQEKSTEELQKNNKKKASDSQKKASDKMQQMSKKMKESMMSMQAESLMEDINNLRQILENLITLSFNQESIMMEFRRVNQSDPRYVSLGQEQLKLRDDAQIIEDSLMSLASRVFQIESFVTREVTEMNGHMEEAMSAIKDRKNGIAAAKQQFAMTSMNNLALMLDETLKQMQEQMASQMSGEQMCSKPKDSGKPSMGQMQKQLNDKIGELKKSGKQGKSLSEELAKLAQQQEQLRKDLEGLGGGEGQMEKDGGKKLSELERLMEETEKDLVHKKLTDELLQRQADILTRLLESEKAQREREMDPKRESKTAKDLERSIPPNLTEYLKEKESQTEMLKTISPAFNPYFRQRANAYFDKINE